MANENGTPEGMGEPTIPPTEYLKQHAPPDMDVTGLQSDAERLYAMMKLCERFRRTMFLYSMFAQHMSEAMNELDNVRNRLMNSDIPPQVLNKVSEHVQRAKGVNAKLMRSFTDGAVLEDVQGKDPWKNPQ